MNLKNKIFKRCSNENGSNKIKFYSLYNFILNNNVLHNLTAQGEVILIRTSQQWNESK